MSRWPAPRGRPRPRLRNIFPEPPPPQPVPVAVPRPVDQEGLALDLVPTDEAPVAAVLRVVPVVAHDEVRVWRHLRGLAAVGVAAVERAAVPGEQRGVLDVGLGEPLPVDVDVVAPDEDLVAWGADDALDEVTLLVLGVPEHDDVPPGRIAQ